MFVNNVKQTLRKIESRALSRDLKKLFLTLATVILRSFSKGGCSQANVRKTMSSFAKASEDEDGKALEEKNKPEDLPIETIDFGIPGGSVLKILLSISMIN